MSVPSSDSSLSCEAPLCLGPEAAGLPSPLLPLCCVLDNILSTRLVAAATGESRGAIDSLENSTDWVSTLELGVDAFCED